jgi:L-glyceraldehyde 3-phosphate reductase
MNYTPNANRYANMLYRKCGNSGLKLPAISLGLWQNFGDVDDEAIYKETLHLAFDNGITHFDLANNYGPKPGSAETNFGRILHNSFSGYRDELVISSKAGYHMWPGPYGEWGSKKYMIASLDQSLKRTGLSYFDIFYHHRPDPNTPLEESMMALDLMVRQGKALYVGISNYDAATTTKAVAILKQLGTPCLIHQPKYNMLNRWVEPDLLNVLQQEGVGCIPFSPLAQGLLSNKYLNGIPQGSRATKNVSLRAEQITDKEIATIKALNTIAEKRGQSLAQMALAWLQKDPRVTSVLIGASSAAQLADSLKCLDNLDFAPEELAAIEAILNN